MAEPHERLDRAMEDRRLQLRLTWAKLARDAKISPQALRAIRKGEYKPSRLTAQGLDNALRWKLGSVEAILSGDEPQPAELPKPMEEWTLEDARAELAALEAKVEELIARDKDRDAG